MASLQSHLDEFKHAFESGAPPYNAPREDHRNDASSDSQAQSYGNRNRSIEIGESAPEFSLFNQDHVQVNSADLLRQGPVVVSFFPGHW
jgi:hypothetical protein